jgi:DNA-binding transcriptional LysR family regulator
LTGIARRPQDSRIMELRHLRYFVAVAEHLHFGRAAEALMTAQPSLSRQILQLEDELGVRLFDRTNRHVALTDAGRIFLVDARRTLQAADASMRHARENAEGTRGELRIGFIVGAMLQLLPSALREYRRRYPNIDVSPHIINYLEAAPALLAGNIDIAWSVATTDPDIVSQPVARDRVLAALPTDHRLAKKQTIDVGEFSDETLVAFSRSIAPRLYDVVLELCLTSGYHPPHVHEAEDALSLLGLVAAGFGVSLIPFPWSAVQVPGVVFKEITSDLYFEETLSWHRDRTTPIVRAFVNTTVELLAVARIE